MKKIFLLLFFSVFFACESNTLEPVAKDSGTFWTIELAKAGHVKYEIYNSYDLKIITLVDEELASGRWNIGWFNNDEDGLPVPEGIYKAKFFYDFKLVEEFNFLVK